MTGRVAFQKGQGGLPMLRIETASSATDIYLHGAHVTHFQRKDEPPLLWMSRESRFEPGKAIRGGVPVILPWFGPKENAPAHGFARVHEWELVEIVSVNGNLISVHLRLPECEEMKIYGAFTADYLITADHALELELIVGNPSHRELIFEECLHSYFHIGDISEISVTGLKGAKFLDKAGGSVEKTETNDAITFSSETDRVYMDTSATVEILDRKLRRKIIIEKEDSLSTVVWNPWIAKSKAMPDFGDEEYHGMVCVESGNVGKNRLTLAPGKSATMRARISSENIL